MKIYKNGQAVTLYGDASKDLKKAYAKADALIKKAIAIRNRRGYSEGLGYNYGVELGDYNNTLCLSYNERAEVMTYYFNACHKI